MKNKFKVGDKVIVKGGIYSKIGEFTITSLLVHHSSGRAYAKINAVKDTYERYMYIEDLILVNKWESICV